MDARGNVLTMWEGKRGIEAAARTPAGPWRISHLDAKPQRTAGDSRTVTALFVAALHEHGDAVIGWQGAQGITTVCHPSLFP